ncbi:MAG TPA: amidohydrolase family protein [Chloroflexota bacterium]|nr:amidohydrolase family protein [Chloroflexota bacterium]
MRNIAFLAGSALALLASSPAGAEEYTFLLSDRPSGTMQVTQQGQERLVAFSFNDRGRGVDLKQVSKFGPGGIIRSTSIKGVDYLKVPLEDSFSVEGGKASWKSRVDAGSSSAKQAFYIPYLSPPEHWAALVRALLAAPGQSLDLLPAGRATLRKHSAVEVSGDGGARETATLYTIVGPELSPKPVWLDSNGELFFSGSSWNGTIRKGFEKAAPALVAEQGKAISAAELAAAKTLGRKPSAVLIRNANLFDAKSKLMRPGTSVLLRGTRIEAVGPDASIAAPAGAEIIDAGGKSLLPGLWDMHVHLTQNTAGLLHLGAGVTSVRDLANDTDELLARRKRFDSGELPGPRVSMAGFIDGPGPMAGPTKVLAATPEEITQHINRYADLGYDQIKLYSSLKPELVPVAVKAAHARGMSVSGHVPATMVARDVVNAGFDEIQHANFIVLNFFPETAPDTATMKRISDPAELAANLDLDSPEVRAFIAELKAKDIVVDPTLGVFEAQFTAASRDATPGLKPVLDRLPPTVARGAYGNGLAKDEAQLAQYRASWKKMLGMVAALHRGGVRIVPGTDGMAGFMLHRELELWAEAGISNLDILYAATLGSASVNNHDKELGSVEAGKLADLVLVDGDPSKAISDIRKTRLVIKDGVIFKPPALYAQVGIRP